MKPPAIPITDDHIHIDPVNGRGIEAAKDFRRSGGTHIFLVSKPSWSFGIEPSSGEDYREVFEATLRVAEMVRETGLVVYPVLGVHPAEMNRLAARMTLDEAAAVMMAGLDLAARYVEEGRAVALKSGRPHYEVPPEVLSASNAVLFHALELGAEHGCAVQLHAESGPCIDVVEMAAEAGIPIERVVKHFATPETPLMPSFIARHEDIPALAREGRRFTMESDYMDENSRPGAVIGPKSVPRFTRRYLEEGLITEEDAWRIHVETPSRTYGVDIALP
ncbi:MULTISPECIES: TatD family hydrolase [Methanoculleus]|jgi:TatD-related deoxyribonuclease|uniref:TatD-related deoxyribonuclease n=1 Tax=Methanoculleus thermophilus TaxID=2200 RepID=A0A1G8YRT0_9EURY|nr:MULTISPECIES: TatD family hydrolase [Methanoculleus]NLN08092.1 hydrolase TatD [Methanoculleus thermophilus]SDK05552.1 TatD-related deoxyribonuclease [Methanoculleus thermophilus]HQD26078.1 TatD family hydrolase [Methanoculleus thermophilus]